MIRYYMDIMVLNLYGLNGVLKSQLKQNKDE